MEKKKLLFLYSFFVLYMGIMVQGSHTKLFVFGDSYADTGNHRKPLVESWKEPYGITFPGKPSGRYSDGRVMTDFFASIIGIRSPIPYKRRRSKRTLLRHGMNFAFGGTGVFKTLHKGPNMTTQIGFFKQQIHSDVYSEGDVNSSIALVSLVGNDYNAYLAATKGAAQDIVNFTTSVITQLALNLKSINKMGVRKIAVTGLQPLGCLPSATTDSSHQQCNETFNDAAIYHNYLLENVVEGLNKNNSGSTFMILDLYGAFSSILQSQEKQEIWKFKTPLKPCCEGISDKYSCGSVDEHGEKKYTVCKDPKSAFFWDGNHPTQQGWKAISAYLKPSLLTLYKG